MGLSKIGGLIAIFKIFTVLMALTHRRLFERRVMLPITSGVKAEDEERGRMHPINNNEESLMVDINRTHENKASTERRNSFGEKYSF